jgi:hypothetical protein
MSSPAGTLTAAWRKLNRLFARYEINFAAEWGRLCNLADVSKPSFSTTGTKLLSKDTVPSQLIQAGSRWKADARGNFSSGGSAPTGVSFFTFWQGTGGTQIGEIDIPAAGLWSGASNAAWSIDVIIDWDGVSETVVDMKLWWRTAGSTAATAVYSSVTHTTSGLGGGASGPSGGDMALAFAFTGSGFTLNVISARVAQEA